VLTITHINYIREIYFAEGKSISEICKMTGRNYRTIKKYIETEDFNESEHKAKRPNKSDILRPIIRKWLLEDRARHHKQRHTAKVIYKRLKKEHPDILDVSERTVRTIVKEEKEKIYGSKKAYLLLNHPGGEAQVDFGTFYGYEQGGLKKFHELILSFPKSNAGFAVVTRSETRQAVLEGLVTIFKHIEYVPIAIWFDQMSSAALRTKDENGVLKAADFVTRFSMHYGFNIKFCNPNSGNEKGNVENKVGTIRRNLFVPEPIIKELDSFNQKLLEDCDDLNKEDHYRLKEPKTLLFEQEKELMVPVSKIPFDTAKYETRKVNKYGLVEFSGCRYSASPRYIGQFVNLKIMANEIEIFSKDFSKKIAKHPRLFQNGEESIHHIDFIDVIKTRPNALKYSGIYTLLPEAWQDYLQMLDKEAFREAFNVLKIILLKDDMAFADKVLKETIKHDSASPEAVAVTYRRLKENRMIYETVVDLPSDLPSYEMDTSQYDRFFGGNVL